MQSKTGKQYKVLFFWALAGTLLLTSMMFLNALLNGLPLRNSPILLPGIFGGILGLLYGWHQLGWRSLNRELSDHRMLFQEFYQNTPAMLHSMDSAGHLVFASQSWLDCLGYRHTDIIGKDFFSLVVADDVEAIKREHLTALQEHAELKDVHYTLKHVDGREVSVSISETALKNSVSGKLETMAVMTDLASHQATEDRIEKLAYYDTLTGLPNRALLIDRMHQSIALARRDNRQIGVFFFDLDRFKMINDTQGHAVGDLVLRSVAQRLKKFIREGDTFARLGGDEFVIIQADPKHDPNFTPLANRVLETLNETFQLGEREFYTTASIGVAVYPLDGEDPQALLKSADTAMYVAKSQGRNNFQFFSGAMNAAAHAKSDMEVRLRAALDNNELKLYYQAQYELETGRVIGIEALLRLNDAQGKPIPPDEMIAVAEESGLIYPIGEWTLEEACRQAKAWQDAGLNTARVAVNLSGHHIRQANFIDRIEEILEKTGLDPGDLEIELSETSVMGHVNDIIMSLTDLKVRGIHLAIDDFGVGYSSLLYLMHFPIQRIKIAQEFIAGIPERSDYAVLTEAIIAMAKSLRLSVSAVGVESAAQLKFLQRQKCDQAQGNYFSPVMTADDMAALLKNGVPPQSATGKQGTQDIRSIEKS